MKAEDSLAIAKGIECLFALNEEMMENMGERGREFVMRHFSYALLAKKFIENC